MYFLLRHFFYCTYLDTPIYYMYTRHEGKRKTEYALYVVFGEGKFTFAILEGMLDKVDPHTHNLYSVVKYLVGSATSQSLASKPYQASSSHIRRRISPLRHSRITHPHIFFSRAKWQGWDASAPYLVTLWASPQSSFPHTIPCPVIIPPPLPPTILFWITFYILPSIHYDWARVRIGKVRTDRHTPRPSDSTAFTVKTNKASKANTRANYPTRPSFHSDQLCCCSCTPSLLPSWNRSPALFVGSVISFVSPSSSRFTHSYYQPSSGRFPFTKPLFIRPPPLRVARFLPSPYDQRPTSSERIYLAQIPPNLYAPHVDSQTAIL
ncbi:hypothetical protein ACRALDRAFT_2014610 [Sodiomyces alcalophilus JCM 7366]|uniref:uncharacterized protein n=1 Tax=Sodiomyces alcalophilus JCM 7366 TaxID=591952 RepID=UPI0039B5844C